MGLPHLKDSYPFVKLVVPRGIILSSTPLILILLELIIECLRSLCVLISFFFVVKVDIFNRKSFVCVSIIQL